MKKYTFAAIFTSTILFLIGLIFLNQPISDFDKKFEAVQVKLKKSQIIFYDVIEMPEISPEITKLVQIARRGENNLREVMTEIDKAKKISLNPPILIPFFFFLGALLSLAVPLLFFINRMNDLQNENTELKDKFNLMSDSLSEIKGELNIEKTKGEEDILAYKEKVLKEEILKINEKRESQNKDHIEEISSFQANRPSIIPSIQDANYLDWICQDKEVVLDRSMQLGEKFNHIIPKEIPHNFYLSILKDLKFEEEDKTKIKLLEDRDNRSFLYQVNVNSPEEVSYNLEEISRTYKYLQELSDEFLYSVDIQHDVNQKDIDFNLKITVPT